MRASRLAHFICSRMTESDSARTRRVSICRFGFLFRDGAVSRFLHEHVSIGDVVEVRAPTGAFTIDARGVRIIRVLSDIEGAEEGVDYEASGRINTPLINRFLPFDDYDFYVCGPSAFTQALYHDLREQNVPDGRIHAEAFGPSALVRKSEVTIGAPPRRENLPRRSPRTKC